MNIMKEDLEGASKQVLIRIYDMIEKGDINTGDKLVELKLSKLFNVSRTPVRQALNKLKNDGVVSFVINKGFVLENNTINKIQKNENQENSIQITQQRQWEKIYSQVEQELLMASLHGSLRINEVKLAEHYNVSRSVTRDVLARMHADGLIDKGRTGTWFINQLTPDRIRNLYMLRALLEPHALQLAAPRIKKESIHQAQKRIYLLLQKEKVEGKDFIKVEQDLHIDLIGLCPNQEIIRALERTHILFAPTKHLFNPVLSIPLDQIQSALHEHLEILDLLAVDKAPLAAEILSSHLEGAIERWLGRFEKALPAHFLTLPKYLHKFE